MSPQTDAADFARFVALQQRKGRSPRDLAKILGCAPQSIEAWSERAPPVYVGLALAALAAGLPPWKAPKRGRPAQAA